MLNTDAFYEEVELLLEEYGQEATTTLKRSIRANDLVASNKMVNSIKYSVQGSKVTMRFDATLNIVDRGRRRGQKRVSSDDILEWMKNKNIRPKMNRSKGRSITQFAKSSSNSGYGERDRNLRASAFMISKAISDKGTIKRFGHTGAKIIKKVREGSIPMRNLKTGLKELMGNEIKLSFRQIKTLR